MYRVLVIICRVVKCFMSYRVLIYLADSLKRLANLL